MTEGGRAWLEVRGSAISTFSGANTLTVGEHTVLSVHTQLPGQSSYHLTIEMTSKTYCISCETFVSILVSFHSVRTISVI